MPSTSKNPSRNRSADAGLLFELGATDAELPSDGRVAEPLHKGILDVVTLADVGWPQRQRQFRHLPRAAPDVRKKGGGWFRIETADHRVPPSVRKSKSQP